MDKEVVNSLLQMAASLTAAMPGMENVHENLDLAVGAAPTIEAAVDYFQTAEGRRAIAHVKAVARAIQPTDPVPAGWSEAQAIALLASGDACSPIKGLPSYSLGLLRDAAKEMPTVTAMRRLVSDYVYWREVVKAAHVRGRIG